MGNNCELLLALKDIRKGQKKEGKEKKHSLGRGPMGMLGGKPSEEILSGGEGRKLKS